MLFNLPSIVILRIIFITAMINLASILLILLSCRCINMWRVTVFLTKHPWYKRFFKWHCYLWYVLLPSILVHAVFALSILRFPF